MENVWPPKEDLRERNQNLLIALVTATSIVLGVATLPISPQSLFALAVPVSLGAAVFARERSLRYEANTWRSVFREGATLLVDGRAYLALTPDGRYLHCSLASGSFVEQEVAGLTMLKVEAPMPDYPEWSLRCERVADEPLHIRFRAPRDAEAWYWRLLTLRPELGRDVELMRAQDLWIPAGTKLPDQFLSQWAYPAAASPAAGEVLLLARISPEYAGLVSENLERRNIPARTSLALAPPELAIARVDGTDFPTTVTPTGKPLIQVSAKLVDTFRTLNIAMGLTLTMLALMEVQVWGAFAMVALLILADQPGIFFGLNYRRGSLIQSGLHPQELLALHQAPSREKGVFVFIPENGETGYYRDHFDTHTFQVREVRDVTLHVGEHRKGMTIALAVAELSFITETRRDTERLYCQLLSGLNGNPHCVWNRPRDWVTVTITGGKLAATANIHLWEEWLDLDHHSMLEPLPIGPLVGPVSPAFGAALVSFLTENDGEAGSTPFSTTDPKPYCLPPGRPYVSALVRAAERTPTEKTGHPGL